LSANVSPKNTRTKISSSCLNELFPAKDWKPQDISSPAKWNIFEITLLETAPNPILVIDEDSAILYLNPALEKLTGYAKSELLGEKTPYPFWPEEKAQQYREEMASRYKQDGMSVVEQYHRKKNGEVFWITANTKSIVEGDEFKCYLSHWVDITERKKAKKTLRESENKYRNLFDTMTQGVVYHDAEGKVTSANPAAQRILGVSFEEMVNIGLRDHVEATYFEDGSVCQQENHPVKVALKTGQDVKDVIIKFYNRQERDYRWLSVSAVPVFLPGKKEKPHQVYSVFSDITSFKEAEYSLRESESEYRTILENVQDIFYRTDLEGKIVLVNPAAVPLLGATSIGQIMGKNIQDFYIHPEEMNTLSEKLRFEGAVSDFELTLKRYDGRLICVSTTSHLYKDSQGQVLGVEGMCRDITEHKKFQEEQIQSLDQLQKVLRGSIDLAAKMVELRDPYTAGHQQKVAKLASAIARDMGIPEERVNYINMAAMVHDIGKINVPSEILSRTGKLTDLEFQFIKTHAQGSYDILKTINFPWPIAEIVRQHHERMDGSGYPRGLKGDQIKLEARILAVADTIEAMAAHRPYRSGLGVGAALEEITNNKGTLYDTQVVESCLRVFYERGFRL
jgi:PAS domain S-box-containing protein/putative nucleotidyltransferase with HDIG domain